MTSDGVIAEAAKDGYRPATLAEAIAFTNAYPDLQRQFWIVILGSFVRYAGNRDVPVLGSDNGRRDLGCCWFGHKWSAGTRFLLVRM
jgi:hypothetical protein